METNNLRLDGILEMAPDGRLCWAHQVLRSILIKNMKLFERNLSGISRTVTLVTIEL